MQKFNLQSNKISAVIYQKQQKVFDTNKFMVYLTGLAGGSRSMSVAKSICNDVDYFFSYKKYQDMSPLQIILNKQNLRDYMDHLQKVMKFAGTTVAEKINRLKIAIDHLTEQLDKDGDMQVYIHTQEIYKTLNNYRKTLRKTIKEQRLNQAKLSYAKVSMYN